MAMISYDDLSSLKDRHPGKKIVFCSGSFDLTHIGHVLFFEACKNLGDILVVAVGRDKDIRKNKGLDRPILNEDQRLRMVSSLKPVDYAFLNPLPRESEWRSYLGPIEEIFKRLKPDLWAVNHDGAQMEKRKELSEHLNIPLIVLQVPLITSTTSIIKKIRGLK